MKKLNSIKHFLDYTAFEKHLIIMRGGYERVQLERSFYNWVEDLPLPADVFRVINDTDPVLELFGLCESMEDILAVACLELCDEV